MPKIEIKNFGPIKDVTFGIKDYTVFIGPQASGKSTIVKLFYYFRKFNTDFVRLLSLPLGFKTSVDQLDISHTLQQLVCKTFHDYWEHKAFFIQDFNITYNYSNQTYIKLICKNKELYAEYSTDIIKLFEESRQHLMNFRKQGKLKPEYYDSPMIVAYHNELRDKANKFFGNWNMKYIPAGRHVFPILKDQPVFIKDKFVRNFSPEINYIKSEWENTPKNNSSLITKQKQIELVQLILKGSYSISGDEDGIMPSDFNEVIPLVYASSGQQESLWVLLSILNTFFSEEKYCYIIEEPEAHLFPEAQRNIMHLLTYYVNNKCGNQLMITTHSPYILTPLNNLLQAYLLGQNKSKHDNVSKIIDPKIWINPDHFECYYVDNGNIESIVDSEVKMMNLEKLDNASRIGNDEYDKLSELED
ncbi:MAG: ATP-binding protein [Planctomycetaceae bacterium]|nr:ATP-binding protein [Planctomycetaceae bacterium]